jgi:hypothetical protein
MIVGLIIGEGYLIVRSEDGAIEPFSVHGEMDTVTWYRKTGKDGTVHEYNGKYVSVVEHAAEAVDIVK